MDENELLESEVNYISKKRTVSINDSYYSTEISMNINPELGLDKSSKWLDRKLTFELQRMVGYAESEYGVIK